MRTRIKIRPVAFVHHAVLADVTGNGLGTISDLASELPNGRRLIRVTTAPTERLVVTRSRHWPNGIKEPIMAVDEAVRTQSWPSLRTLTTIVP